MADGEGAPVRPARSDPGDQRVRPKPEVERQIGFDEQPQLLGEHRMRATVVAQAPAAQLRTDGRDDAAALLDGATRARRIQHRAWHSGRRPRGRRRRRRTDADPISTERVSSTERVRRRGGPD
ncbi:hypothetical protein, partial [Pseudonocardia sp.]|uniref:hypothetical protein n=1 Tax=Pseudonocardia sp. TaxID=60912 RepID=UPI0031FD999F